MVTIKLLPVVVASLLLAACEARIGRDDKQAPASETAATTAQGKAEEGTFSIDAPGFDMKLDIPAALADNAEFDSDSGILYPGAKLSGMHIEASDSDTSRGSGVELRFTSADAPGKLAAWYRDPARAPDFSVASAGREGDAFLIGGIDKDGGDPFSVRIAPRAGGGSEARLTLRDKS